jgi:hypothetical protein
MSEIHLPQRGPAYSHTLRVTFAYDGKQIRLVSVQRVAMRVPAPTTPAPSGKSAGYWFAIEDPAGETLFHFPLHDPLKRDHEVFDDPEEGKPHRVPSGRASGEFEILVPDLPQGARLVLHGPQPVARPTAKTAIAPAAPLVEHTLDELRRLGAEAERNPGG